jgi:photosystem II stability/assembly factor-like uncharacterized protein
VPAKCVLLGVAVAGERVVAVGERGRIVFSDDYGFTWHQAVVPVSVTLTSVYFVSAKKGLALGHSGVVLESVDGGETWTKRFDGRQAGRLIFEACVETATGKVVDESHERVLANAQCFLDDGPDKPLLDIYFEDEKKGFIVGAYNMMFRTEDGGRSWEPWLDHVDNPEGLHLYGIDTLGDDLFMAGEQGLVLHSTDQGKTFKRLLSPYEGSYFGLVGTTWGELIIFGLRGNAFKSSDRGITWQKIDTRLQVAITAAAELRDSSLMLTTQTGDVLVSRDKGDSFERQPVENPFPIADIAQAPNGNVVLVGLRGVRLIPANPDIAKAANRSNGDLR